MTSAHMQTDSKMIVEGGDPFLILTVGWDLSVISRLADPLERSTGYSFAHVLDPSIDRRDLAVTHPGYYLFREDVREALPEPDPVLLASLERPDVPTIHNMIMGDRVVRNLDYRDATAYATRLARRLEELYGEIRPSVVIGGYDGLHSGLGCAVARKLGIPWFALKFTALPTGMSGFCTSITPENVVAFLPPGQVAGRALAEQALADFESQKLVVPAYLSANSAAVILKRLPGHLKVVVRALSRQFGGRFDRFTRVPVSHLAGEYVRKRVNLTRLPLHLFLESPPDTPYLFLGFHMQPESSIDVWAPFFSDQFSVVETIARSCPPTHQLLVKLHKSDADNYSRRQLRRLENLPGVRIVSPFAQSRPFIERAALVFAIQGNIALEAALLGRPVLLFGDSRFVDLASVTKVGRVTELPDQIRTKLGESAPSRDEILRGFETYLSHFAPGCHNDWRVAPTESQIRALSDHFVAMRHFLMATHGAPVTRS